MNKFHAATYRLNPCFNGRYSQSEQFHSYRLHLQVLILVLMEDTLRVIKKYREKGEYDCLNPCFNGRYSQS